MTTIAQLRKAALALPGTDEGTHFGMVAFRVRNKGFASVSKDRTVVHLQLTDDDADAALADHPTGERFTGQGKPIGISVPLADINGQALNHLVRRAWFARAPQRLAAEMLAADDVTAGSVGDLPAAIGRPATRALAAAGITTLDQVADRPEHELQALHGVGPKAIRILGDALEQQGRTW